MGKRSRLRSRGRSKSRLIVMLVLTGFVLFLGLHFFRAPGDQREKRFFAKEQTSAGGLLENRGVIFDRNYKKLAETLEKVSVYADVRDVDRAAVIAGLGPVLDLEDEQLQKLLASERYRVWLAKNISQEEEEKIQELGLHGVYLHKEKVRQYPQKESAAHIVGFVGEGMGLAGVEYAYNNLLNKYGRALLDSGAELVEQHDATKNVDKYLVLTIDLKIQQLLEKMIAELAKKKKDARFAALLMESSTGKIIGQAAYPSYDPNLFHKYDRKALANILAEPISVPQDIRKILWNSSLVQSNYESKDTLLPWSGVSAKRDIGSQFRLWEQLGFRGPLEVDYLSEEQGALTRQKALSALPALNQYDSVVDTLTPLQIASAINALYRGGEQPVPHVIDRIAGKDGRVFALGSERKLPAVPPEVANEIRKMLQAQMQSGPLDAATLETSDLAFTEQSGKRSYVNNRMFFSLIPRENPELMLFVFTQLLPFSPSSVETKSRFSLAESVNDFAVPIVAIQKVMSNLSDMMTIEEKSEMNFEIERQKAQYANVVQTNVSEFTGTMPNLKGLSLRKSLRLLKDLRLEIQISGTGVVVQQTPNAGLQVRKNSLCRLVLKPH